MHHPPCVHATRAYKLLQGGRGAPMYAATDSRPCDSDSAVARLCPQVRVPSPNGDGPRYIYTKRCPTKSRARRSWSATLTCVTSIFCICICIYLKQLIRFCREQLSWGQRVKLFLSKEQNTFHIRQNSKLRVSHTARSIIYWKSISYN